MLRVLLIRFIDIQFMKSFHQHSRLSLLQKQHQCFPFRLLCKMAGLMLLDIPGLWKALKKQHLMGIFGGSFVKNMKRAG